MKKLLKKLSVMRLEERVLFDAAAAAAAAEAEQQAQQNEELQQQQQQLQEQLAEEAAKQQSAQQAAEEAQESESEAAAPQETEQQENAFDAAAATDVAAAVEAIAADEGVEVEAESDVLEVVADETAGDNIAEENAIVPQTTEEIASAIAEGTRHELVIVSNAVKDSKVIIDSLAEGTEVLVLDNESDVLDQINEYLDKSAVKYDAIHVVSHGGDGYILLNNSVIDMTALKADPASWAAIGEHIAEDGDIMLYGCNVAQTENGKAFANQLATLTGADIAASVDATGGAYGWELEYMTDTVAAPGLTINGYDNRLASLTLVEQGSVGTGADTRNWDIQLGTVGKYYGIGASGGQTLDNSDGTTVSVAAGQLYSVEVTEKTGEGGTLVKEKKYTAHENQGDASYILSVAAGTNETDTIVINYGNIVDTTTDLGNVANAVNGGGLTINGSSEVGIKLSAGSDLTGALSISTAQSVSVSGTVNLGEGGSLSISNVNATTGTAVSTGAITGREGSVTFSNITASDTNNAVNVAGAINAGNVNFSGISADAGKAVNVTGAINAETVSFTNISTVTGSHAIDLNGLTLSGEGSVDNVIGNVDIGNFTGGDFSFNGEVKKLDFGSVTIQNGTFSVNVASGIDTAEGAKVTFAGAVNITAADFSVEVEGNRIVSGTGEVGGGGRIVFNNTFTVSGTEVASFSEVTLVVKDLHDVSAGELDRHVISGTLTDLESGIIFNGNVSLGQTGNDSIKADFSAKYIEFNGDLAVGAGKGSTNLTVHDFAWVKFNANSIFSIGEAGPDGLSNDTVTFTAIDRLLVDEQKIGYFGDKYRVEVGKLDIGRGAELVINNVMMDVRGTTVTHYGNISGEDSELTFRNTVNSLKGVGFEGGTVDLASVRYENGLTEVTGGSIYRGHYDDLGVWLSGGNTKTYTIAVNLFELVDIDNITFINQNDDTADFVGSHANVEMSGRFYEHQGVTVDFEVGSKVNVIYNSTSQQYVLGGNYYELTVTNTAEKILAGSITVGVSAPQLKDLRDLYDTDDATDLKILARKMEHLYRGGISLGTTLKTQGNTADFYGYTYSATDKAMIDASGPAELSNTVSYHVAHQLINIPAMAWGMGIGLSGVAHETGGVGPDNATGTARVNEDYKAFFGGIYQNLVIDTMPSMPEFSGVELLGQDEVTFNVDVDATVNGGFLVQSLKEGNETKHHHLQVNVDSTMTFNNADINLSDASLHFNGSVLGNIRTITANRDNTFGNSGALETSRELELTFAGNLAQITSIFTDGIALTFNGDVDRVGTIDVYGSQSNVDHAKITFNGSVEVLSKITTHTEYDTAKPILRFNGETSGAATVNSYRSDFIFNYDGDQTIWGGTYDDIEIDGTGEKTLANDVTVKGIFNGNESSITIAAGKTLEFSTIFENTAADPHSPHFTVMEDAKFHFGAANTTGTDLYGTITSYGEVEFFGRVYYYGTVTLESAGSLIINNAAQWSHFDQVINRSSVLEIDQEITIAELHNYGTMTVTNNDVALNVYNHNGADIIFDLKYGTADNGAYSYTFDRGETGTFETGHNRLVNGGTITINNGTLNLTDFTQGDKNAETGKWTYGGEAFVINAGATLVLGASAAQVNSGNVLAADMTDKIYLGDITNRGTFQVANSAGSVVFTGNVANEANSKFILSNTEAIFHGDFIHEGSLTTTNATAITFSTEVIYDTDSTPRYSTVSGNGTIGGTTGYTGEVSYKGAYPQQILNGTYNNTVTLSGLGERIVAGNVVFNSTVHNNAIITGTEGSVVFNGNTTDRNGAFSGTLDVTYSDNATVIYGGSYGDLVINSTTTTRNIAVDITANNLTLTGSNTFNGVDAENTMDLIVNGDLVLGDASQTAFGAFSTINAGSEAAAVIKGGKGGATLTVSTAAVGENVSVNPDGMSAAVTFNYAGEAIQRIWSGSYLNDVTVDGSAKSIVGTTSVTGLFASTASALTVDGTLEVLGTIDVGAIEVLQGAKLNLNLTGASTLGTAADFVTTDADGNVTDASATGVIMGGTLNVNGTSTLTVYGWQDKGSAGAIHLYSGNIEFAGTPDVYGYVGAILSNYTTTTSTSVVDHGDRLQNWWITITQDSKISDYEFYTADTKFRVINGATLTVDYFAYPNPSSPVIDDTVKAFRLEDGSTLVFAMTPQYLGGTNITVNELIVQDGSSVVVNEAYKVTVAQSADIYGEGAVQGAGNLTFRANGTYTGDGTFNMTGGKVVYGSNANVYAGTYNDLQLYSNNTLAYGVTTVNGVATLYGTGDDALFITDGAALTFAGTTNANDDVRINGEAGTSVTYGENADIYAGTYGDLTVQGEGARTILGNITVDGTSTFAGSNLAGSGEWVFNGEVFGNENGTSVNNTGSVTYVASGNIFGGTYENLILDEGNTISANLTAENVRLSDGLNVTAGTTVTFNGSTDADTSTDGYISAADNSSFIYGENAQVYNGIYGNLTIEGTGEHTLLNSYIPALDTEGITVNGTADLNGVFKDNAKVTFNGETSGDATFGNIASDTTYTGTVTYGAGATTIYGGQYNNIVIAGDSSVSHTVNSSLLVNVPSGGIFELASELSLAENVTLTINGFTDANAEGNTGSITGHATSEVLYSGDADVYGGSYGKLTFTGSEYTLLNNFSVAADALINGNIIGSADIVFNGAVSGNAVFGNLETNEIYSGSVTYAPSADQSQTVFGGNYSTLNITGSHELNQKFAVNTAADFNDGIMSGSADITFAQGAVLTGNGTIGAAPDNRYQGNVAYNGVSGETGVFGGFYSNLVLANGNSISAAVDAADVKLSGVLTVTGTASVNFAGTTDAAASDNDGAIEAEAGTSVVYSSTADVYGGTYGDLTIAGAHNLFSDITVNGNAVITGEQTLVAAVYVTFAGTTNAAENTSGTFKEDGFISNVTYGADAAVFGGTYGNLNITGAHILSNSFEVTGAAAFTGKQTLGSNVTVTFTGTTNANEQNAEFDGTAGSVIYDGAPNQGVYGGTYGDLTITGDPASNYERILNNHFTVKGVFASGAALTGNANVTFLGTTTDDGTTFGTESSAYAGRVVYGETAAVYGGFYNTLTITGNHILTNDFAVNTTADISGVMSGSARILFAENAQLAGNGAFGSGESSRYNGEVFYYGVNDIYGGFYSSLTLANGNTVSVDVNALNVNLASTLTVSGGASVVFAGTTSASTADISDIIIASAGTSVTYGADADIYGGSYSDLTVNGAHTHYFDIAVSGTAAFTGVQTLSNAVTLIFSGLTNADAAGVGVITADTGDMMVSNVVYLDGAAVFGGSYENLQITGNHTLNNDFTVSNEAAIEGIMLGNAAVAFSGTNTGSGTFGSGEASRYNGVVTYNGNAIYGGYYSGAKNAAGLIITDGTINAGVNVDAASVELTGILTVNGSIIFSGYTDAVAKGDAAEVYSNGSVAYADTADIYGGSYGNLIIRGDHHFAASLTVSGTTTVLDNADGSDASLTGADGVALVFTGGVTGNGAYFGDGTNAFAGSVTYNGNGEVLGGIYRDLTVSANNEVMGSMTVTGMFTLMDNVRLEGRGDWIISENNASENSTATIANSGSVTYNGLRSGEAGWIFGGTYADLIVNGGDYSVGLVTITNSFSGSGKYIFTAAVNGVGGADNANADYLYANTLLWGVYNNLGIGAAVNVGETVADIDVTVNGALTALNSSAVISGYDSTLLIAGTMSGFDSLGRFAHSGNVIFSGNAEYNVDGGSNGSSFGTVTVGEAAELNLTNTAFTNMIGGGDVTFNGNVNGNAVDMRSGTVTYAADAVTELIEGNYYNLVLAQGNDPVIEVAYGKSVVVSGLLDVNGNDILNSGNLTIYRFTNTADTELLNSGNLTFGSNDGAVGSPDSRQIWEGIIKNSFNKETYYYSGDIVINRSNYSLAAVLHEDPVNDDNATSWGTVTIETTAQSKADFSDVVTVGIYSVDGKDVDNKGTVINLNANAYLFDVDNTEQFTNRGTLNIGGLAGVNAAPMHIINVHQGEITVSGIDYTFGKDSVQLTNGGSVTVNGENGVVIFNEVNENIAGNPVYTTRGGGTFIFDFAKDSINVQNGLLGDLKNFKGQMYFLTDGMKYLGEVTNGSGTTTQGNLYIWADSTFRGSVSSTYGIVEIADGLGIGDVVEANFLKSVTTGSYFRILDKGRGIFESTLLVAHDFVMEDGAEIVVKGNTLIKSDSGNTADTVFHVKSGATATFYGDVTNQNGYYHGDAYGWYANPDGALDGKSLSAVSTPATYKSEYYGASNWVSELRIDGKVTINGVLTNLGHGLEYRAFSEKNQARVVVESDGNVFGAIRNIGMAARFDMNGSNNQFNGSLTNSGELLLNGTNDYNDIINTSWSTSFTVDFGNNDKWSARSTQNGYIWINDGATGSTFRKVTIESGTTFTVGSYDPTGIRLTFNGVVDNSGTFNINAAGFEFNDKVTNSGTFNVFAFGHFDAQVTNRSTFNVLVPAGFTTDVEIDGVKIQTVDFNAVQNSGHFTIKTNDVDFDGRFTNSGTLDINVGGIAFNAMTNSGQVNLHGALQTVINDLTVGNGGVVDIDKASSLHLHVVTENGVGSFIVRGDARDGSFADHTTPDVTDSEHGLFFEDTGALQLISSSVVYDTEFIESAVWFDFEKTIILSEEAKWVIIGDVDWADYKELTLEAVGETAKYKVYTGGTLTVTNAASRTSIRVLGGDVTFDNDSVNLALKGFLDVQSGTVTFNNEKVLTFEQAVSSSGEITFNAGSKTVFNNGFNNAGTVAAYTDITGFITNTGIYTVKSDGMVLNASNFENANGTLGVDAKFDLTWDAAGTINVLENGILSVGVTSLSSHLANAGVVEINNASNYLFIGGDILNNEAAQTNGKFTAAVPASLVIGGNVEKGASATFENIANVSYEGYAAEGQNIILGTYNNLTLSAGSAMKIVDDGTVTVNGNFTNGSGVQVTDDGSLILNQIVTGDGSYTNAGTLTFGENASGSASRIDNSGTVNVNADNFSVADASNTGNMNVNGDNAALAVINQADGVITVNGKEAKLGGWNLGDVVVEGSAVTTMKDLPGATYNITENGALSLGNNGGTYNAAITNSGTLSVDAKVTSFAGGVTNKNVINVNEGEELDIATLFSGNSEGTLNLNDETNLQNQQVNGNVQVNYVLSGDALAGVTVTENSTLGINKISNTLTSGIADNKGTVQISKDGALNFNIAEIEFSGNYDVDGTLSTNGAAEFSGTLDNSGTVSVGRDAAFVGPVANSGSLTVGGAAEFGSDLANSGTAKIGGSISVDGAVGNEGDLTVGGDADFGSDLANSGSVKIDGSISVDGAVGNGGDLTVGGAAEFGGDLANSGSASIGGSISVDGAVGNEGDLTVGGDADFNGDLANSGSASIGGSISVDGAVGNEGDLTVGGDADFSSDLANSGSASIGGSISVDGVVGNEGDLAVGGDADFSGDLANSGKVSIGGSAAFDNAVSNSGNISVGGSAAFDNAVSNSGNISVGESAAFDNAVSNSGIIGAANVIFSGATSGNGAVKALTASYEGNATGIFGGTYGNLSISTKARMLGDASTGSMTLYGSLAAHEDGALSIAGERFSSENFDGSGSGNWSVFTAVGGVGDAWPSLVNPNFQAIAVHMGSLSLEWGGTGRFDIFRRMPVDRLPLAVGDTGDAIEFNTVDSYDMINFDGEFFGEEGISILDDESRDVLEDAVSAEASDLKALLED